MRGIENNSSFWPLCRHVSEMVQERTSITIDDIGSGMHVCAFDCFQKQWSWMEPSTKV